MPSARPYRITATLAAAGLLVLLGGVLLGGQRLAFRDVGHFYAPLYAAIGQQTAAGQFSLWNPLDHTGIPLAGETTTAWFYPPRLVFALPLSASIAMGIYVGLHLLLAAVSAAGASRQAGVSAATASFVGIAYAFSGPIVFLYCNPPFLVGAAWLPAGLAAGLRLLVTNDRRSVAVAAFLFAMPVLGGDPQTPLHIAIFLAFVQLTRWLLRKRCPVPFSPAHPSRHGRGLLSAIALAVLVTMPQLAASLDWSRHSARRFAPPSGVSRLLGPHVAAETAWWQPPAAGTHAAEVYAFSVAPWQCLDLFVPAACGPLFPQFERWSTLLPDDSRIWAVSLYGGVLVLLLALLRWSGCRRLDAGRLDVWDSLALLGIAMALGRFGPVWFLQQGWLLCGGAEDSGLQQLHSALLSPYWTLTTCLPGYGSFRYPAKWLPFVSLGLAIAAGRQLDTITRTRVAPLRWLGGATLLASLIATGLSLPAARAALLAWLPPATTSDAYWGPLELASAFQGLAYACRHTALFAGLAFGVCWWSTRPMRARQTISWLPYLTSGLLLVDLLLANQPLVATVDVAQEQQWLQRHPLERATTGSMPRQAALRTGAEGPLVWQRTAGLGRVDEVAASERRSLQGRWHLVHGVRVLNSATSLPPQRYQAFASATHRITQSLALHERPAFWQHIGQRLQLTGYLHTSGDALVAEFLSGRPARLMDTQWIPIQPRLAPASGLVERYDGKQASVRLFTHWQAIPPQRLVTTEDWTDLLQRWVADDQSVPPQVELAVPLPAESRSAVPQDSATTEISGVTESSDRIRLRVTTNRAALLSRDTLQDGNWKCRYRKLDAASFAGDDDQKASAVPMSAWQTLPVHPVDYLHQGVCLPAGRWQVEFAYRPWWRWPSYLAAAVGCFGLCWLVRQTRQRTDGCMTRL